MTTRRSRGEGGLSWETKRQRWIAAVTVGYDARGKRIMRRRSARTKTEAKELLRELVRDLDDGLPIPANGYTVTDAVKARSECECLVFVSRSGTALDSHNVRRGFRVVVKAAGLTAMDWTPREMRHSFVSLLSDDGMPIEHIARLVGHTSTAVTETVYRQQIRPVIIEGAEAMDRIFRAKD
jgi:hypothetical protein